MHEFLIPILTGISLLLAGILVGYFLWFRNRNDQIAICHQLAADRENLNSQLRDAESQAAEVQDQLLRRKEKLDNLQSLCNDLLGSREKIEQHARLLESELYASRLQLERLNKQFVNEDKTLCASLEIERNQNQLLIRERDQALKDSNRLQAMMNGLEKRSENQESTIRMLRSRLDETLCELSSKAESQRQLQDVMVVELQQELANAQEKIQGLEDQEEWKKLATELQVRLDSLLRQRDSAFDQLRTLTDEMSRLKNHARINEDTIRNLRRERGAVLLRNRQSLPQFPRIHEAPKEEYSDADLLSKEYGGPTRIDPIRGVVFIEAPRVRDDLKKIYGVANVLEQRLNASGIYAYRQIMKWDEKAIREFSELLVFKDRIYRDDWLGQAARLYLQKQRAAVA